MVTRTYYPEIVWTKYADAIGLETLKQVFGQHWPPARPRALEEVYCWRRAGDPTQAPAAWLSLSLDQFDPQKAWMSRGVWPDQHGQSLGKIMRTFAEMWCRQRGARSLNIWVSAHNPKHLVNVLADHYWRMDAVLFEPPTFGFSHKINDPAPPDPRPEG